MTNNTLNYIFLTQTCNRKFKLLSHNQTFPSLPSSPLPSPPPPPHRQTAAWCARVRTTRAGTLSGTAPTVAHGLPLRWTPMSETQHKGGEVTRDHSNLTHPPRDTFFSSSLRCSKLSLRSVSNMFFLGSSCTEHGQH